MSHESCREFLVVHETPLLWKEEVCCKQQALDDVKTSKDIGSEAGMVVTLAYTPNMQVPEAQGSLLVLGQQDYKVITLSQTCL